MTNLSYTQEYFLCAVNGKGNIPALNDAEISACFIVGGITELLHHGYIARDEKDRLIAGRAWNGSLSYVEPLYETIVSLKRPPKIADFAVNYFESKPFYKLLSALGISLAELGCADELIKRGWFKEKIKYAPKTEAVQRVVEKIRAEFLEEGTITEETLCLAALLDASGLIRNYFSKFEAAELKKRIKEVRQSETFALVQEILDTLTAIMVIIMTSSAAASS